MKKYFLSFLAAWAAGYVLLFVSALAGFVVGLLIGPGSDGSGALFRACYQIVLAVVILLPSLLFGRRCGRRYECAEADARRAFYILLAVMVPLSVVNVLEVSPFLSTPGMYALSVRDLFGLGGETGEGSAAVNFLFLLLGNAALPALFHWGWKSARKQNAETAETPE